VKDVAPLEKSRCDEEQQDSCTREAGERRWVDPVADRRAGVR
jgi:hypothetical protein